MLAQDKGAAEKAPTVGRLPAIEPRRAEAGSSVRARARLEEEEEERDGTSGSRVVTTAQLAHEWVRVCFAASLSPFFDLFSLYLP